MKKKWKCKDCECYQEGMRRERERILNIIRYIDRRIVYLKMMIEDKTGFPERYEFYARINELKELKQEIKEEK